MTTIMGRCNLNLEKSYGMRQSSRSGFTLVELIVAASLSVMLLASIFSATLFFTKSGLAMADYSEMDDKNRLLLQIFSQDVRAASAVNFSQPEILLLTVEGEVITYTFSQSQLFRTEMGEAPKRLAENLSEFAFRPYDMDGDLLDLNGDLVSVSTEAKMLQLYYVFDWSRTPSGFNSENIMESARFMLRNRILASSL